MVVGCLVMLLCVVACCLMSFVVRRWLLVVGCWLAFDGCRDYLLIVCLCLCCCSLWVVCCCKFGSLAVVGCCSLLWVVGCCCLLLLLYVGVCCRSLMFVVVCCCSIGCHWLFVG